MSSDGARVALRAALWWPDDDVDDPLHRPGDVPGEHG
jgi:hypothetical protein